MTTPVEQQGPLTDHILKEFTPALDAALKAAGMPDALIVTAVLLPRASDVAGKDVVFLGSNMPEEDAMTLIRHLAGKCGPVFTLEQIRAALELVQDKGKVIQ